MPCVFRAQNQPFSPPFIFIIHPFITFVSVPPHTHPLMAYFTCTYLTLIAAILMLFSSSEALPTKSYSLASSTISAAPTSLPDNGNNNNNLAPSSSSPALSPDISPLFPTPGGPELSPSESIIPIIPSSPSPPNPDLLAASGPGLEALAPSQPLPDSSSDRLVHVFCSAVLVGLGLMMQLLVSGSADMV